MADEIDEATSFEFIGKDDDWAMLEGGNFKGMTIGADRNSGLVVSLSARHCRDNDRWTKMPSLEDYASLKELDLHKSRYMKELHVSICGLQNLQTLILTRCDRLTSLPTDFGKLSCLQEVRMHLDRLLYLFFQDSHIFFPFRSWI